MQYDISKQDRIETAILTQKVMAWTDGTVRQYALMIFDLLNVVGYDLIPYESFANYIYGKGIPRDRRNDYEKTFMDYGLIEVHYGADGSPKTVKLLVPYHRGQPKVLRYHMKLYMGRYAEEPDHFFLCYAESLSHLEQYFHDCLAEADMETVKEIDTPLDLGFRVRLDDDGNIDHLRVLVKYIEGEFLSFEDEMEIVNLIGGTDCVPYVEDSERHEWNQCLASTPMTNSPPERDNDFDDER